jgi:putative FmdB family regulatory protein
MPTYDYRCLDCKKRFDVFLTYAEYGTVQIKCKFCNGTNVERRIGRIRISRTGTERMQNLADPSNMNAIEDDPRTLGRMMREMRSELGEEMPAEFDEVVNRLERGQTPEQISQDIPDLGDDAAGSTGLPPGGMDDLDF